MSARTHYDVITTRTAIRNVAAAWMSQYRNKDGRWAFVHDGDSAAIYQRLHRLKVNTATADDVAAIIGNRTWTQLDCDSCETIDVPKVVRFSTEGGQSVQVCESCLASALDDVRGAA